MNKRGERIGLSFEGIANLFSSASHDEQLELISYLIRKLNLSERQIKELNKTKDALVPANIFNEKLSCLEAIVKFLKEEKSWDVKDISLQLNRSSKTIWATYYNSVKKFKQKFELTHSKYFLPVSMFKSRYLK